MHVTYVIHMYTYIYICGHVWARTPPPPRWRHCRSIPSSLYYCPPRWFSRQYLFSRRSLHRYQRPQCSVRISRNYMIGLISDKYANSIVVSELDEAIWAGTVVSNERLQTKTATLFAATNAISSVTFAMLSVLIVASKPAIGGLNDTDRRDTANCYPARCCRYAARCCYYTARFWLRHLTLLTCRCLLFCSSCRRCTACLHSITCQWDINLWREANDSEKVGRTWNTALQSPQQVASDSSPEKARFVWTVSVCSEEEPVPDELLAASRPSKGPRLTKFYYAGSHYFDSSLLLRIATPPAAMSSASCWEHFERPSRDAVFLHYFWFTIPGLCKWSGAIDRSCCIEAVRKSRRCDLNVTLGRICIKFARRLLLLLTGSYRVWSFNFSFSELGSLCIVSCSLPKATNYNYAVCCRCCREFTRFMFKANSAPVDIARHVVLYTNCGTHENWLVDIRIPTVLNSLDYKQIYPVRKFKHSVKSNHRWCTPCWTL